jgi:hypothetical protein
MSKEESKLMNNEESVKSYETFLLQELDIVANAYFNNTNMINSFFRYYLLIISVPITILIPLLEIIEGPKPSPLEFIHQLGLFVPLTAFGICFIGLLVIGYITGLRSTCILYARTANGIRKYFYDLGVIAEENLVKKIRVLPTNNQKPSFVERFGFGFVIYTVAFINGVYAGIGAFLLLKQSDKCELSCWLISIIAVLFVAFLGVGLYSTLCQRTENAFKAGNPVP